MKGLFVSEQYIKDTTPVNDNVDMKLLKLAIIEAQEVHLFAKIGNGMYNDLMTKYVAQTMNADELLLLNDFIRPTMKYWVMMEGLPMMLFKISNKAVATTTSDNSTPVQYEDMGYLVNRSKSKAEVYCERMIRHILANLPLFPKFYNPGITIDSYFPENTQFTTDWYLPGTGVFPRFNDAGDLPR